MTKYNDFSLTRLIRCSVFENDEKKHKYCMTLSLKKYNELIEEELEGRKK